MAADTDDNSLRQVGDLARLNADAEITEARSRLAEAHRKLAEAEGGLAKLRQHVPGSLEPESPEGTYDPKLAAACLAEAKPRTTCGEIDDSGATLEAYEHVLHGTLAPGARCETSSECDVGPGQSVSCTSDGGEDETDAVCVVFTHGPAQRGKLGDDCRRTCDGDCLLSSSPNPARFTLHRLCVRPRFTARKQHAQREQTPIRHPSRFASLARTGQRASGHHRFERARGHLFSR